MRSAVAVVVFAVALPLTAATHHAKTKSRPKPKTSDSAPVTITVAHFSDYHSHALPFYSEARENQGGMARAVPYLRRIAKDGGLVFSGGDMINKGSPAWSDRYRCVEWKWLSGIVDAMAYGNHDSDYGPAVFRSCRDEIGFPILGANVLSSDGDPLFVWSTQWQRSSKPVPYAVFNRKGIRIGVFAIAGSDFNALVPPANRPEAGATFGDPVATARRIVHALRTTERVDAVVLIGHEQLDDDFALARAVPGIDVIFGTHSHIKQDLVQIPGTATWFVSPFQYLTYISRLELTFRNHKLTSVTGGLVPVDASMPADPQLTARLAAMEADLERDPAYEALFRPIGTAAAPLNIEGHNIRDSALTDLVMDVMRDVAKADVAISTSSSFRQSIPAGTITLEALRATLPYDNEIVVYQVTGERLEEVLAYAASRIDSDFFAQVSGVRFIVDAHEHEPTHLRIADGRGDWVQIDRSKTYRLATTDYVARIAPGYSPFFKNLTSQPTGLHIRDEVRKYIVAHSPVTAARDGRVEGE